MPEVGTEVEPEPEPEPVAGLELEVALLAEVGAAFVLVHGTASVRQAGTSDDL